MEHTESTVIKMTDAPTKNLPQAIITSSRSEIKNTYVSKKTVAQGMFDVALFSANMNQLVHLLVMISREENGGILSALHITVTTLLGISILLQVIVGGCLITIVIKTRDGAPKKETKRLNNVSTFFIFFITILNVMIPCFTPTITPFP